MRVSRIKIPIYFGKLVIIQTDDWKLLCKRFKLNPTIDQHEAFVLTQRDQIIVVFREGEICPSIIAHEAVHIVNEIFLSCSVQLDLNNDEPQAYLTGWVVKQIHKFLKS